MPEAIQVADRIQAAALGMIVTERLRQQSQRGYTVEKDRLWGESEWTKFLTVYLGKLADCADVLGAEPDEWRTALVKVAALATAALEADILHENPRR